MKRNKPEGENMSNFLPHIVEILLTAYGGLLLRAAAFMPCAWSLAGGKVLFPGDGAVLSLILWLVAVMPFRNWGYMRLRKFASMPVRSSLTWVVCFRNGAVRVARGLLYGLPFYFLAGSFWYGYHFVDFKSYYSFLRSIGEVFGGKADLGVVVWLACILAALVLFVLLWKKDQFMDFRDITIMSAGRRPKRKDRLINIAKDFLLLLPSVVLWALILAGHYAAGVDLGNGALAAVQSVFSRIKEPIPGSVLLKMGLILVFVHMPLAIVRKTGDAQMYFKAKKRKLASEKRK